MQRATLVPLALAIAVITASCAQKRQTTQATPPTASATSTGSATNTGTGYGGSQSPTVPTDGADNGSAAPSTNTPPPESTVTVDSGANQGTINQPDNAGFPDPTPPSGGNGTGNTNVNTNSNGATPPANWSGVQDDIPAGVAWSISSLDPQTKVASDGTVTVPGGAAGGTTPPTNAGGAGTSVVGYEGRVADIINQSCVGSCHVAGGTQPSTPMDGFANASQRGSRIVARANGGGMPPNGPLAQADIDLLKAWQTGGFKERGDTAAGGGGNAGATAGQGLVLEIADQRYGNYLNPTKIVGKVGQTLKIVNKRTQSGFVIHTNGAPFDHGDVGNPIPPGGSQDYRLNAPYQGTSDVYEHTDGSLNTDRLINLEVQP